MAKFANLLAKNANDSLSTTYNNNMEEILNVEVVVPQLEYTTHEQYTMQQEREANRKLKAQIRKNRKLKKGIGIKQQVVVILI